VSKKISRGIYKPFVYDLEKNQITQELRNGFLKKFSDIELFQNQNTLSLLTGEYEWETDLGGRYYLSANEQQEAKISQIIGIIDDKLYVWMNDDRLVVLAIATGTILSETFPLQNFKDNGIVKYVLLPQYRESEQSLLFFYQDFLITIHLPTQTTSLVWQDDRYNIGPSFITDHSIYFIVSCEKGALFRDHVGVFDREKNEVVWMQQVIKLSKKSYNNLKEIQASDDKIYVLDTEGTLYIFEKGYDSI
ncbi:MAG TPA: hypothetical protein VGE24_14120, partial [Emticicia sp.]